MAVCWQCPDCREVSCEDDLSSGVQPLACDHCGRTLSATETLCAVCESPNPWSPRDSLHYICRTCGNSQTFHARASSGGPTSSAG